MAPHANTINPTPNTNHASHVLLEDVLLEDVLLEDGLTRLLAEYGD
jgi:hypothetical protein